MKFLKSFREKKPEIFPCQTFLSGVVHIVYQSVLIPRKLPCSTKVLGYAPVTIVTKNSISDIAVAILD